MKSSILIALLVTVMVATLIATAVVARSKEKSRHKTEFYEMIAEDALAVELSRRWLADIIAFMDSEPDLFPPNKIDDNRLLTHADRAVVLDTWRSFLDQVLILDILGKKYNEIYLNSFGERKRAAFRLSYAAFLTQYRYALDFTSRTERDPTMHKMLNEADPERAIEGDTYKKVKFRFLNVLRGAEFARLEVVYNYHGEGEPASLTTQIDEDRKIIWNYGKWEGPMETARNAVRITKDALFTSWFPVQKGVAYVMGKVKVHRIGSSLISADQVEDLHARLEPGDILLERREWYLTNLGLPGFWTHVALYIGTAEERAEYFKDDDGVGQWIAGHKTNGGGKGGVNSLIEATHPEAYAGSLRPDDHSDPVRVIESIAEGVTLTSLEYTAKADSIVVLRPRLPKYVKARAILRAFGYQGRPYDYNFDFVTDTSLVCTELVYKSYQPTTVGEEGGDGVGTDGLRLPIKSIIGRMAIPANDFARLFNEEYGKGDAQMEFIYFLDGYELKEEAIEAGVEEFRESWKRPKWHIIMKEM